MSDVHPMDFNALDFMDHSTGRDLPPPDAPHLVDLLRLRARQRPDDQAYAYLPEGEEIGTRFSYASLDERARAIAAGLQAQGSAGDRVLLLYPACAEFIPAFFGCLYAGMVAVPAYLPKQNKHRERLDAILQDAGARLVLTDRASLTLLQAHNGSGGALAEALCLASEDLDQAAAWQAPVLGPQSLAFLQYTSGSTGKPKGVMVSHGNVLHNNGLMQEAFGLHAGSVFVSWLPTFHDMGLVLGMLQPLYGGFLGVLMPPNAFLQRPSRWLRALSRFGGTATAAPNFAYELCAEKVGAEECEGLDLSRWASAVNGAEPVRWATLQRFAERFAPLGFKPGAFLPAYGMAEGTLYISGGRGPAALEPLWLRTEALEALQALPCDARQEGARAVVPCGRPLGQRLRIVDPASGERARPGHLGEIWIQGPSVAQAYWGQEEASLQAFGATLAGDQGRYLRTGDLGFLHQGQVVVAGRLKDLVIVRGVNYFPQDIEATLQAASADLRAGCGAAFTVEGEGEEKLVLVQELLRHPSQPLAETAEAIRRAVMMDQGLAVWALVLVRPGSIPKTSSGKIQRRACRLAFQEGRLEAQHTWSAALATLEEAPQPSGPLWPALSQRCLALGCLPPQGLKPATRVLSLGLDSLQVAELQAWLKESHGIEVALGRFYEDLSLEEVLGAVPAPAATGAPMTPLQQSFYLARLAGEPACFVQVELELAEAGQCLKWQARLDALRARHQALRLGPQRRGGGWWLDESAAVAPAPLQRAVLPASTYAESRQEALDHLMACLQDPQWQAPYAGLLLESPGRPDCLVLCFDHLYVDGLSLRSLLADLGADVPKSAAPSYVEGLALRDKALRPEAVLSDSQHWLQRLRSLEPSGALPPGFASGQPAGPDLLLQELEPDLGLALQAAAKREGVTVFALYVAAYAKLWAFWLRQDSLVLNTPVSGRPAGLQALGCYADILPLILEGAEEASLPSLARQAQKALLEVQTHASVSGVDLARDLAKERGQRPQALSPFTITSGLFMDWQGSSPELKALRSGAPSTWMDLSVFKRGEGAVLAWNYERQHFSAERVERLARQMKTLLQFLAAGGEADAFSPLLEEEDLALHRALNAGQQAGRPATDLVTLFQAAVQAQPEALALIDGSRRWTYGQLDADSQTVALRLQALGVQPGALVALCLERSAEAVLGILGILKAGAAYLPLDPVYPAARLNFILEDAQPAALLIQASLEGRFEGSTLPRLNLDPGWDQRVEPLAWSPPALGIRDSAYVIYTSGSTGQPKGVVVRHGEVARLLSSTEAWFGFGPQDTWTLFHSYAFDFSVWEIWGALLYGGRLVVVPAECSRNPAQFYELCRQQGVTVLNQTPAAFYAFLAVEAGLAPEDRLQSLRTIVFGGEALDLAALRPWYERHGDSARLVNMYGITETTVHVTYRPLTAADALANHGSLIGVPIPDLSLHVLDAGRRPVPVGVAGELYVGGAGLALGYLKRPELTEARFIGSGQGRLYRSGDLARFLPGGELDYVGRADQQVKIRGFRVELGEITEKVRALPGLRDVAVLAVEAAPGDKRLVAYVVLDAGARLGDWREALSRTLPDYMVPAALMCLDALPLTENGKLDRRALPQPQWGQAQARVDAADALEGSLLLLWKSVLGTEEAGVEDDLFAAGGHSLLAARLLAEAAERFHCRLSLGRFLQSPTVRALAAQVREALPVLTPQALGDGSANASEQSLWLLQADQPDSGRLNVAWALWSPRPCPPSLAGSLEAALQQVLQRHAALRTAFVMEAGQVRRQQHEQASIQVEQLAPRASRDNAWTALQAWAQTPFQLDQAPLLRAALLPAGEGHWLAFCAHHIIFDLQSLQTVMADLGAAWEQPQALGPAADGFTAALVPAEVERLGEAWDALLEGYDGLPPFSPAGSLGRRALHEALTLDGSWSQDLAAAAQQQASSPFQLLLCAWQLCLLKASGRRDLCVGSAISQRQGLAAQDSVGYFANLLPLRLQLAGDETGSDCLRSSQAFLRQAMAVAELPLPSLIQRRRPPRLAARHPLFQCALVVQAASPSLSLGGLDYECRELPSAEAKLDLALVIQMHEGLELDLEHAEGLLAPGQAAALLQDFRQTLRQLLDEPERAWNAMAPAERPQALGSRPPAPGSAKTVVQLFAERVHADHTLPALRGRDGREHSYGQLAQEVRAVAGCLAGHGIQAGDAVGVFAAPGPLWVAATLGVMEAGAVYVPLDPAYPQDRLRRMAQAAGLKALLVDRPWPEPEQTQLPCLNLEEACRWSPPYLRAPSEPSADSPAYLIFTSGSSGEPKGVLVNHGALANHAQAYARALGLGPGDTVMQFVPISFDASLEELLPTLCAGACLALPQASQALSVAECHDWLEALDVTVAHFPAAYWHAWAPSVGPAERQRLSDLRAVVTGGEAPDAGVLKRFLDALPGLHYFNAYGPTEAAITCLLWHLQPGSAVPEQIPLGRPLEGVLLRLVGEEGSPVSAGESGELWIGGLGLAQGYWGDPALTQQRFVTLGDGPDARRYYRSGDLLRLQADGSLVYAGRRDDQVKISGYRVELGEIESCLRSAPGVQDAAARLEKQASGPQIWAWVVPQGEAPLDLAALRAWMAARLPAALLPSRLCALESLPRTVNGKLDRAALMAGPSAAEGAPLPAEEEGLQALVELWRRCLGRPEAHADTDFFAAGGSSLTAVKLAAELSQSSGQRITLDALYQAPSPRQLQLWLGQSRHQSLACLRKEFGGFPLLWLHPVGGQIACYRHLTEALAGAGPVYAMQADELSLQAGLSVADLAERYADHLEKTEVRGPWVLAGWSMGGLLACELSHVLKRRGSSVALLALLDTVLPDPVEGALLEADGTLCRRLFESDLLAQGLDPTEAEGLYPAFRALALALHRFRPRVLDTPLALLLSEATLRDRQRDPLAAWARLASEGLTFKSLPGDHYSIMQGPAAAMAADFISAQARKAWALVPGLPKQSGGVLV